MHRMESDPEDGGPAGSPRQSDSPPVGEPLVVSRRAAPRTAAPALEAVPTGPLAGQVGLVTGATGELGAAFVDALVDRGARVWMVDGDLAALRGVADRVGGDDRTVALRCDVGSADDVADACDFVRLAGTSVDLVVHAATAAAAEEAPTAFGALDAEYAVGVRAPSLFAAHLAPSLTDRAGVLFVDRLPEPDDDRAAARRTVIDAARRGLVDVLRSDLADGDVRLLSATCSPASDAAEFASLVLDAACRPGDVHVTGLVVESVAADDRKPDA